MTPKRLALFDFDGTITTKDTLFEFIRFYHGSLRFLVGFAYLSPMLIFFKLGFIKNQSAKEKVLSHFFSGTPLLEFNRKCEAFVYKKIPDLLRLEAMQALTRHLLEGTTVAVVSASPENWVSIWCQQHDIRCLASRLQIKDDKILGKINGLNCYGDEKVNRVKEAFDLTEFKEIYAYGDSGGDKELLALATHPFYRIF